MSAKSPTHSAKPLTELAYATRDVPSRLLPGHTLRFRYALLSDGTTLRRLHLVSPAGHITRYPPIRTYSRWTAEEFYAGYATADYHYHQRRQPKPVRLP